MTERFGRLSTGLKIFSIFTLALLPLGLIALFASLSVSRTADLQRSADLRVALTESTRKLSAELASDISTMRSAADAIAQGVPPREVCNRVSAIFAAHGRRVLHFAVFGAATAPLCASRGFAPLRPSTLDPDSRARGQLTDNTLDVRVPAKSGSAVVFARYPAATLADFAQPSTLTVPYALSLSIEGSELPLRSPPRGLPLRSETVASPVGVLSATLSIAAADVPFGAIGALLTFLPLLMWASAALIAFLIVDRVLIRPLHDLRFAVATHVPGTSFRLPPSRTPAREIRELGETFAHFEDEITQHQADLARALADQTKATREVHHRVKNNLQIIASLISLHARGPHSPEAATAYAAIQRRVDALSIVHRNHYAELDADGIDVNALIGELATNLRASAGALAPTITIRAMTCSVRQDVAVAIAFLITELVELSMTLDDGAAIAISVEPADTAGCVRLALTSTALRTSPTMTDRLSGRYERVIQGLARQLRAPLAHDQEAGCFAIDFAIVITNPAT